MDDKPKNCKGRVSKSSATKAVVLTALFFIFMWCHDIAVTSLMNGLTMYNGFFSANAAVMYHVSFYGITLVFLITMFGRWHE